MYCISNAHTGLSEPDQHSPYATCDVTFNEGDERVSGLLADGVEKVLSKHIEYDQEDHNLLLSRKDSNE